MKRKKQGGVRAEHGPWADGQIRKRFRTGDPLVAALVTYNELLAKGEPADEALRLVGDWLVRFGAASKSPVAIEPAMASASHRADFVLAYLIVRAVGARLRGTRSREARWVAVVMMDNVMEMNPGLPDTTRLVILPDTVELLDDGCPEPLKEILPIRMRMLWGLALVHSGSTERRDAGFRLLEEQRERAAARAKDGGAVERALYAQILHNAADVWLARLEGDIEQNVRRAIEYYDASLTMPERLDDPPRHMITLRGRGSALRQLAAIISDPQQKADLLRQAIADARQAAELGRAAAGMPLWANSDGTQINLANAELDLIDLRRDMGQMTEETARSEARRTAERVLPLFDRPEQRSEPQLVSSRIRFEKCARIRSLLTEQDLAERLWQIATPFESQPEEILNPAQANALAALLGSWGDERPLPSELWQVLGALLARVDVLTVGPHLADGLLWREQLLLAQLQDHRGLQVETGPAEGERKPFVDWLGSDRIQHCHRMLANPALPGPYKDIWSAWIAALAYKRLAWHDDGTAPLSPLEFARFVDLLGTSAFRSESAYFGQGEAFEPPTPAREPTEGIWRCDVYRTRQVLDHFALSLTVETLDEPMRSQLRPMLGERVAISLDGVVCQEPKTDPRDALVEERQRLYGSLRFGAEHGWFPPKAPAVPTPCAEEIGDYLREHRSRAIAVVGPALGAWSLIGSDDGDVETTKLWPAGSDASSTSEFLGKCLDAFVQAKEILAAGHILTPNGREVALEEARCLPPAEAAKMRRGPATAADCDRFNDSLRDLLDALSPLAARIREACQRMQRSEILMLSRLGPVHLPLAAIAFPDSRSGPTLGDLLAVAETPSLARAGARPAALRTGAYAYVGSPARVGALEPGRAALRAAGLDVASPPLSREVLERSLSQARTLSLFMHGHQDVLWRGRSWLGLDDTLDPDDPRSRWTAAEISSLDLTGCARAELWACESADSTSLLGLLNEFDEPSAIDGSFLLAGARCAVSALWSQPLVSASLIAAAFQTCVGEETTGAGVARALARATSWYRETMQQDGVFMHGAIAAIQRSGRQARTTSDVRALAAFGGWVEALEALTGRTVEWRSELTRSWDVFLAPVPSRDRQRVDLARRDPVAVAAELVQRLASPWSWAGWRVIVRDKECM